MKKTKEQIASEWVEKNYFLSPYKDQLKTIFLAGMNYIEPSGRSYDEIVPNYGDLMPIAEWNKSVDECYIMNDDGYGYWVKDGMMSHAEVFSTSQEDATHVVWFNK
jgi:hypothetical protein